MISCDNPKNLDSGVEPYAVTNMYLGPDNHYLKGYAPHSWITRTAGWVYRCITEYICGVQPTINGLKINPCLPSKWNSLRVVRKFRGTVFEINYVKSSEYQLLVDGKAIKGNVIPLQKDNGTHVVTVKYK
jgi:cellobiose phosphorylase